MHGIYTPRAREGRGRRGGREEGDRHPSARHLERLCQEKPLACEGRANATWVLLDYGPVVCHVFKPESRDYFRLERLWGEGSRVELDLEGAMPASDLDLVMAEASADGDATPAED